MVPGVEHVGGSLLDFIPSGDAILMKVCTHIQNQANVMKSFNSVMKFLYHTDVDSQLWNFKIDKLIHDKNDLVGNIRISTTLSCLR